MEIKFFFNFDNDLLEIYFIVIIGKANSIIVHALIIK